MLHAPLSAAAFSDNATESLIRAGVILVAALGACWAAGGLIRRLVGRIVGRPGLGDAKRAETRGKTIASVFGAIVRVAIGGMATLLVLGEFGFDIAPLIAGAGIIGLAVGFGAQGLVSDVVSGLFMLVEDQYGVGDWVDLGEATGVVERVGLRTTRVRSVDGLLWTLRNGEIARTANANKGWGRAVVDVDVGYDVDLDRTQDLIREVAERTVADPEHRDRFLGEPEVWGIQELGESAVTVRIVCKTEPTEQWGAARLLRLHVKQGLDAEGVELPFPQRTVWLRTEQAGLSEPIPVAVGGDGAG